MTESLSKLLNNPEKQAQGYLNWLIGVGGYYYTAFIHDYEKLTLKEYRLVETLLLHDIKEYYHTKIKGFYLEELSADYDSYTKTSLYLVKQGIVTKGKATIATQVINDKFYVTLVYATRSKYGADAGQPNHFRNREPNLSLWTNPTKEKSKRRYKSRKLRKKEKANRDAIEFNKVHTSDARRHGHSNRRTK